MEGVARLNHLASFVLTFHTLVREAPIERHPLKGSASRPMPVEGNVLVSHSSENLIRCFPGPSAR